MMPISGTCFLDGADGAADEVVRVERLAARPRRAAPDPYREKARSHGMRELGRALGLAHGLVDGKALDAGHGGEPDSRVLAPSRRNSGQIRSSGVSTFSRTMRRVHSALRLRRSRVVRAQAGRLQFGGAREPLWAGRISSPWQDISCRGGRIEDYRRTRLALPVLTGYIRSSLATEPEKHGFRALRGATRNQDTARAFARDEMMPHAREWDEEEVFPVETLRAGGSPRLCRHLRGRGCRRLRACAAWMRRSSSRSCAKGCTSTAAYLSIHNMVAWMIDRFGDELRLRCLPELCAHGACSPATA